MEKLRNAKVVRFKQPGGSIYVAANIDKKTVTPEEEKSSKDEESNRTHWIVEHIAYNKFCFKSCYSGKYLAYEACPSSPILQSDDYFDSYIRYDWEVVDGGGGCGGSSVALFTTHQWSCPPGTWVIREPMRCCDGMIFFSPQPNSRAVSEWEVEVIQTKYDDGRTMTTMTNQNHINSLVLRWPQELQNSMSTAAPTAGTFLVCNSGQNSNSSGSQHNGDVHVRPSTVICYGQTNIMYHYQP